MKNIEFVTIVTQNFILRKMVFIMENLQLSLLHDEGYGFFSIEKKRSTWQQYFFENTKEIYIKIQEHDVYVSQNTFNQESRRLIHLKELKAIYIDIDCYKVNMKKEAVKYYLEKDLYGIIPIPNMLIDSGRGLYYIIYLENTMVDQLAKWKVVEEFLYNELKKYGADHKSLDATRVLRIVGSTNSKVNSIVKVIDTYEYQYTLDEIIEHFIPEIQEDIETQNPKRVKKLGRKKKIVSLYNLASLYYSRYRDILKLVEIRKHNMTGYRETTLFLIRYFLSVYYTDDGQALEEIIEINNMFTEPLELKEVIEATSSATVGANENKYKYSNDKLIKLLDITPLEQEQMSTIISTKEKYRRNNLKRKEKRRNENGLTKREEEKNKKLEQIKELDSKKYTLNEMVKIMGMSKAQIKRYLKEIRE